MIIVVLLVILEKSEAIKLLENANLNKASGTLQKKVKKFWRLVMLELKKAPIFWDIKKIMSI